MSGQAQRQTVGTDVRTRQGTGEKVLPRCGSSFFVLCAKHGTNLAGESPATGFYRQV